jgi:replication factor A1
VSDHTGQTWLSAFNETAGPILGGIDANQLIKMKDDDSVAYNKVFEESNYKTYVFKVRAKMENYQVS